MSEIVGAGGRHLAPHKRDETFQAHVVVSYVQMRQLRACTKHNSRVSMECCRSRIKKRTAGKTISASKNGALSAEGPKKRLELLVGHHVRRHLAFGADERDELVLSNDAVVVLIEHFVELVRALWFTRQVRGPA